MPVESTTTIEGLDENWPLGADPKSEGDNHIRTIKAALKATFPGAGGQGFNAPITSTESELNSLAGITGNVQAQLDSITSDDALIAPSGTVMVFFQAAPPAGWTQLLANDDSMLRVVDSGGGTAGGTDTPIDFSTEHTHVIEDFTLTIGQLPPHRHNLEGTLNRRGDTGGNEVLNPQNPALTTPYVTEPTGNGDPISGVQTLATAKFFRPRYINTITATKD